MSQQKIPLFSGLIKACHDSTTATPAVTPVFTPPDAVLAPGTQAYYAVHLWLKPAEIVLIGAVTDVEYSVRASRGSNPADKRLIWSASDSFLLDVIGFFNALAPTLQQVGNFSDVSLGGPISGIPTKILDGYVVRGDVTLQLESKAVLAGVDQFASPDGTKIWGYYYRIGAENEGYRFIGELPAGPLFDTGLPIKVGPGETKVLHAFQPDRIDEIYLEIAALFFAGESGDPALPATLTFSDSAAPGGTALSAMNILLPRQVRGAPNTIRDPESPYNIYGAWGNNPALKTLQVTNTDVTADIFVHGRFARH